MQIFGASLEKAVAELGVEGKLLYQTKDVSRGKPQFEVWEIDEENIEKLNASSDADWDAFNGWYRIAKRDMEGITELYSVNERSMYGYPQSPTIKISNVGGLTFDNVFSYLVLSQNIFREGDIAATVNALAEANSLSLAEFMHTYYG